MFTGTEVRDLIFKHLNGVGNTVNLEGNASKAYDDHKWAIQAEVDNGKV
jgi:hypothetical protein